MEGRSDLSHSLVQSRHCTLLRATIVTVMSAPPSYSNAEESKREWLPPYKASHTFANSQEELAALKEFAESKLYVEQGTNGTLPDIRGGTGVKSLAWGGPMQTGATRGGFSGLEPETDEERKRRKAEEKERKKADRARRGSVTQRLMRVISGGSKDDAPEGKDEVYRPRSGSAQ